MKQLLIILSVLILSGCSQKWKNSMCRKWDCCPVVKDSTMTTDSTLITQYDTVIFTERDTASLQMYFYCNELNEVIMEQSDILYGKYLKLKKQYEDGQLIVTAYKAQEPIKVPVRTKIRVVNSNRYLSTVQKVNELTKWQRFMINVGYVCGSICLLLVLYLVYRLYRKLTNVKIL